MKGNSLSYDTNQTATSWRDVLGAWVVLFAFAMMTLIGVALDGMVTVAP
jgi:hypothetical protein